MQRWEGSRLKPSQLNTFLHPYLRYTKPKQTRYSVKLITVKCDTTVWSRSTLMMCGFAAANRYCSGTLYLYKLCILAMSSNDKNGGIHFLSCLKLHLHSSMLGIYAIYFLNSFSYMLSGKNYKLIPS